MIDNTNAISEIAAMSHEAKLAYDKKLKADIDTETKILDYIFDHTDKSVEWILDAAKHLNKYRLLTGKDYEKNFEEDTII